MQKVMCLGSEIRSRRNLSNPQFEKLFDIPKEAAKVWFDMDLTQRVSTTTAKIVTKVADDGKEAVRALLAKVISELEPIAGGKEESANWKDSLPADCCFADCVKLAKPLLRGSLANTINVTFKDAKKDCWVPVLFSGSTCREPSTWIWGLGPNFGGLRV